MGIRLFSINLGLEPQQVRYQRCELTESMKMGKITTGRLLDGPAYINDHTKAQKKHKL